MSERPAIFIDIEGFSSLYGTEASDSLWGLSDLMDGIITLGRVADQLGISRIFAHQFGDGFVVVEDSGSALGRIAAMAMALHQYVLIRAGHFCGSAVEMGGLSDVVGCYPKAVTDEESKNRVVRMGDGLMTITPVIGTALIKTYKLLGKHRGGVVVVPAEYRGEIEEGTLAVEADGVLFLNWMESTSSTLTKCRQALRIGSYGATELWPLFETAVARNRCPAPWRTRTERFLRRR